MNSVCISYDEYLQDRDETIWIAHLSDGLEVFCDDGRYGDTDKAWNRLRDYLFESYKKIEKLFIKFRSHTELVAERSENTIGWYFGRAADAWVGQPTSNFMIVGTVEKGNEEKSVAKTTKWRVPEIIKDIEEERCPLDYKENIIWD